MHFWAQNDAEKASQIKPKNHQADRWELQSRVGESSIYDVLGGAGGLLKYHLFLRWFWDWLLTPKNPQKEV